MGRGRMAIDCWEGEVRCEGHESCLPMHEWKIVIGETQIESPVCD